MGLRVKLGWALAVVVEEGDHGGPVVLAREELRVDPTEHPIFGYHAAMEAEPEERDRAVAGAAEHAADAAIELLGDVAHRHGVDVVAIVVGKGVRRIPIERILASNQLFHTAEAELLQDGFAEAAQRLGLHHERITFAHIEGDAAWPVIGDLRRTVGPPWQKDHKHAATAAWIALSRRPA